MSWEGWNLKDTVPVKTLDTLEGAISAVTAPVITSLEVVKTILGFLSKLITDVPDIQTELMAAAISSLKAILEDLTATAGCYGLVVPLRLPVQEETEELIPVDIIYADVPGGGDLSTADSIFPAPQSGNDGGNYGFLQTVVDSLNDVDDVLRPQFDQDAYVGGLVVMAGASTYIDLIELTAKLGKLLSGESGLAFGEGFDNQPDGPPVPRNVRADIVGAAIGQREKVVNRLSGTSSREHPYGVRLEWDLNLRQTVRTSGKTRIQYTITNVVIFRAEEQISRATGVDLADYQIASFTHDGLSIDFFDDTIELNKEYWYGVGYEIEAIMTFPGGTEFSKTYPAYEGNPAFTNIVVPEVINVLPRSGVPPDWVMLPSPLAMIPDIQLFVAEANVFLDSLLARTEAASDKFQEYLDALNAEIARYTALVTRIQTLIRRIADLLSFPDVYVGAFLFSGQGGNDFLVTELAQSLQDYSDPNRPPFDNGDEAVTGFVMYTGSETAGEVAKFMDAVSLLVTTPAASSAEIYADVAEDLGVVFDQLEDEICFLKNLDPAATCEPEEIVPQAIGADGDPSDEDPGCNTTTL